MTTPIRPSATELAILTAADAASRIVLSTQVLCEFYVVTTRRLERPLSLDEAARMIRELSKLAVVGTDVELVSAAVRLSIDAQLSLWDLSHGAEIASVRIENPFATAA